MTWTTKSSTSQVSQCFSVFLSVSHVKDRTMQCIKCGSAMVGDGYTLPYQCEMMEVEEGVEADSGPWYCDFVDESLMIS